MLRLARRELLRWSARYLGGLPPPQGSRCSQKRWRKYWLLSKHKSTPCRTTLRCASQTRSPSTDSLYKAKKSWKRSTWSATSRWCLLSSCPPPSSPPGHHHLYDHHLYHNQGAGRAASWSKDFDSLLADPTGLQRFTDFLQQEFRFRSLLWVCDYCCCFAFFHYVHLFLS